MKSELDTGTLLKWSCLLLCATVAESGNQRRSIKVVFDHVENFAVEDGVSYEEKLNIAKRSAAEEIRSKPCLTESCGHVPPAARREKRFSVDDLAFDDEWEVFYTEHTPDKTTSHPGGRLKKVEDRDYIEIERDNDVPFLHKYWAVTVLPVVLLCLLLLAWTIYQCVWNKRLVVPCLPFMVLYDEHTLGRGAFAKYFPGASAVRTASGTIKTEFRATTQDEEDVIVNAAIDVGSNNPDLLSKPPV